MKSMSKGFSLTELLVSVAIFSILLTGVVQISDWIVNQIQVNRVKSKKNMVYLDIIQRVLKNPSQYAINYNTDIDPQVYLQNESELPIAWSANHFIMKRERCPGCKGRMGLLVQPMDDYRGGYQVSVLIKHEKYFPQGKFEKFYSVK